MPVGPVLCAVRVWAARVGLPTEARGRLASEVWDAYRAAHGG